MRVPSSVPAIARPEGRASFQTPYGAATFSLGEKVAGALAKTRKGAQENTPSGRRILRPGLATPGA
jgi:hypothetical protein